MSDQTTTTEAPAASAESTTTSAPDQAPDPRDQRIAELERAANANAEQAKKYRQAKAAEKEAKEAALVENGNFKALAESLQAERDSLKSQLGELGPLAAEFKADKEARSAALEQRISGLSDDDKALIQGAGNLANQEALASRLMGLKPTVTPNADTESGTKPPSGPPKSLADMTGAEIAAHARKSRSDAPATTFGGLIPRKQ